MSKMVARLDTIVIPSSSPEQIWAPSVSPCTPGRLLGLSPLSSSSPSLMPPSKLFEGFVSKRQDNPQSPKSPLSRGVGKATSSKITTEKRITDDKSLAKIGQKGASKAKAVRNRKGAKPEDTGNKIITGRVTKSTVSKSKTTTTGKEKITSPGENLNLTNELRMKEDAGLNLEEASIRRLDWTPPKKSPLPYDEDSTFRNNEKIASFSNILRGFHYSRENSLSEVSEPRMEGNPTKRRRVELVDLEITREKKSSKKEQTKELEKASKVKTKSQKQTKTITALVTGRYKQTNDSEEGPQDAIGEKPTKQKKKKSKSTKQKEPEYVILSPDVAAKSLNDLDFLFGTSSQLERDDSPTLFRETQKALLISESFSSGSIVSDTLSISSPTKSIATRFTGTKSHWSVAARSADGSVVQPEVIDMTVPGSISTARSRTTLEINHNFKATSSVAPSSNTISVPTVDKGVSSNIVRPTGTQNIPSRNRSTSIDPDIGSAALGSSNKLTDMPNFNGYTDEELSKQISSYGFKAIKGRKKMIALLEKCWQNKNKKEKSSASTSESVVEDQTSKKTSGKSRNTKSSDIGPRPTSRASKTNKTDKSMTQMVDKVGEEFFLPTPLSMNTIDEIEDSEEDVIPSSTQLRVQRESSIHQTTTLASNSLRINSTTKRLSSSSKHSNFDNSVSDQDLLCQITKAIRLQPRLKNSSRQGQKPLLTWHDKILLYDPIILEDFTTWLNTEGFALVCEDREVSAEFVRGWCESQGICCTYRA